MAIQLHYPARLTLMFLMGIIICDSLAILSGCGAQIATALPGGIMNITIINTECLSKIQQVNIMALNILEGYDAAGYLERH